MHILQQLKHNKMCVCRMFFVRFLMIFKIYFYICFYSFIYSIHFGWPSYACRCQGDRYPMDHYIINAYVGYIGCVVLPFTIRSRCVVVISRTVNASTGFVGDHDRLIQYRERGGGVGWGELLSLSNCQCHFLQRPPRWSAPCMGGLFAFACSESDVKEFVSFRWVSLITHSPRPISCTWYFYTSYDCQ